MKKIFFTTVLLLNCAVMSAYAGLPDTGQTTCYDNAGGIVCPLPGEAFYGQDAQYGPNLQSFTKLADNGTALPDNATEWAMVRDNVTGLEWVKDGNLIAGRDPGFDLDGTAGDGRVTWQHALDYVDKLNDENYLGYNDWRLPTVKELSTLVDSKRSFINTSFFPGTRLEDYWSSTTSAHYPSSAWAVYFYDGGTSHHSKDWYCSVRAVRAGQSGLFDNSFVDNGDGTVTDTSTGLMWQQATAGYYAWQGALAYCESLTFGGHDDWRLPNRNELQSLVDYSRFNLAIDTTYFPDTYSLSLYWSSTTGGYPDKALIVNFYGGEVYCGVGDGNKGYGLCVRAVRAGLCGSFGDSDGDTVCDDVDNCLSDYNPAQVDCDNDGTGDACDNDTIDPDGDGVDQTCDICWTKSNPTQVDTNGNCPAPPYASDPKCGDACNVCMADIDNSGKVNTSDLGIMKTEFFRTNCATVPCRADINNDNKVNTSDLGIMKTEFFRTNCFQY